MGQTRRTDGCCCGRTPGTRPLFGAAGDPTPAERDTESRQEGPHDGPESVTVSGREIPRVDTALTRADRTGAWKARWGIGRMHYGVESGLYAVGRPTPDSPVLVSANYKMSFDRLRSAIEGIDAWILVLDTKGINVWCAAGKGTFGTDELVRRICAVSLADAVSHRTVIVPQLGAPGVSAHEVRKRSGFRVVYGPVRAGDVPAFLEAGMEATPSMRRVEFPLRDRLAVVPVELVLGAKYALVIMVALFVLAGLGPDGYSLGRATASGTASALLFLAAFVAGTVLTPALLPWLPGRALSLKGAWIGIVMLFALGGCVMSAQGAVPGGVSAAGWCLLIPAMTSFVGMNFTGATTYTSLSGVRREMRLAVPIQAVAAVLGAVLWLIGRFV
ncbi:MAG TPA: mercury methylation corrinoid protein HgcA [Thermoguttaceae bacterium]|nr:mercury methylation corrinoid protein HgcA [Thermoguttaceae bacterium]